MYIVWRTNRTNHLTDVSCDTPQARATQTTRISTALTVQVNIHKLDCNAGCASARSRKEHDDDDGAEMS